ncbi:Dolichyl-phosphate-mannose-protein mannosyltransferase [Blastococcus fimeti]|nr:Dolichyl-phosphate-mannose-protein mannosyltransferase [Blastococcus fimeti]
MASLRAVRAISAETKRSVLERLVACGALLLVGFFGLVSYGQFQRDARAGAFGDALNYIAMSEQTFAPVDAPFSYRLLTPWLVRHASALTGLAPDTVWLALTFAATTAALFVVYEWIRGPLRVSPSVSLFATLLLSVTFYYTSYSYGNFWLVDPLTHLACALALYLAFRGRLVLFALVIAVGFLNKEAVLLMAPLYPLVAWARTGRLRDRDVLAGAGAVAALVVAYLGFRAWASSRIGPHGTHLDGDVVALAREVLGARAGQEHLAVFGVFGFLWVVFAYGLHQQYLRAGVRSELLLASGYVFAICAASRLQATDTERVFVMLAPLVVGVAATVFDTWRGEARSLWLGVLGVVYAALNFSWVTGQTAVLVSLGTVVGFAYLVQRQSARSDDTVEADGTDETAGTDDRAATPARTAGASLVRGPRAAESLVPQA